MKDTPTQESNGQTKNQANGNRSRALPWIIAGAGILLGVGLVYLLNNNDSPTPEEIAAATRTPTPAATLELTEPPYTPTPNPALEETVETPTPTSTPEPDPTQEAEYQIEDGILVGAVPIDPYSSIDDFYQNSDLIDRLIGLYGVDRHTYLGWMDKVKNIVDEKIPDESFEELVSGAFNGDDATQVCLPSDQERDCEYAVVILPFVEDEEYEGILGEYFEVFDALFVGSKEGDLITYFS